MGLPTRREPEGNGVTIVVVEVTLHRHCHDERHAKRVAGTYDKGQIVEEPDAGKLARPVLKTSKGGDSLA